MPHSNEKLTLNQDAALRDDVMCEQDSNSYSIYANCILSQICVIINFARPFSAVHSLKLNSSWHCLTTQTSLICWVESFTTN